ncbi:hypothetical protein L6V77_04270 [Myxococcota bacterium]|nr:hypothetical protein [Myxococcota bacterium]
MPEPERARRGAPPHSIATALGVAAFALALSPARPVHAQIRDSNYAQVEQELERLLTVAVERYEDLRLDSAASALDLAVNEARDNGYTGRLLAEIHMWRGLVFFARKGEDYERNTRDAFVQALTADRSVRLSPEVATPTLEAVFDTALQSLTNGQVCETAPTGARFDGHITHTPRRRVDAGRPVTLEATVTPILRGRMETFHVFFRTSKMDGVRRLPMTAAGGDRYVAQIPGKYIRGTVLTYYMLVDDREGSLIAQYQSVQTPAKVVIDDLPTGEALGDDGGDAGADESEATEDEARRPDRRDPEPEPEPEPDAGPSSLDEEPTPSRRGGRITAGFALGTGLGRVTDASRPQTRTKAKVAPGMAFAPLHTLLEVDYRVADRVSVGLLARVQLVDFTHLEGLRVRYEALRMGGHGVSVRGGLAYGHISHQVPLGPYRDFTLEGPFGYTLGVSYALGLNRRWSFVVSPDFWHMMGDAPTQHFDLSLGAAARF